MTAPAGRHVHRWTPSTKLVGYVGAVGAITSVVALTIAIIALNASVQQQARQSDARAQQAATLAAANTARGAAVDAACQIYRFNIGEPSDPPPVTDLGRVRAVRAAQRYAALGCPSIVEATPSPYLTPPTVLTPGTRSTK